MPIRLHAGRIESYDGRPRPSLCEVLHTDGRGRPSYEMSQFSPREVYSEMAIDLAQSNGCQAVISR